MRMPDGDTKAAWREQVTELQRALQMATTRMLSDTQQPPSRCMSSSSNGAEPSLCCSYVVFGCAPTTIFQSITYPQTNVDDFTMQLAQHIRRCTCCRQRQHQSRACGCAGLRCWLLGMSGMLTAGAAAWWLCPHATLQ